MRKLLLLLLVLACASIASAAPAKMAAAAQTGSICGSAAHCTVLSWTASTSASSCTGSCSFSYSIFRGTTSGGEAPTAIASVTSTTYTDPVTLTGNPQTFFYYVEAVETSSGISAQSDPSNEVSASFPGKPTPPSAVTAAKQ